MGEAALKIVDEAAGEEAASQTVQLTVIEGGAATAEAGSVTAAAGAGAAAGVTEAGGAAAAAGIGGAVGAGEATAGVGAAAGISGVAAATAGVAAVAVGLGALGYYLYKHKSPENPRLAIPCPSQQTLAPTEGVIQLRCDDGWDDCQKRQAREKVRRLDELAKRNNGLKRRRTAGYVRDLGNTWAANTDRILTELLKVDLNHDLVLRIQTHRDRPEMRAISWTTVSIRNG